MDFGPDWSVRRFHLPPCSKYSKCSLTGVPGTTFLQNLTDVQCPPWEDKVEDDLEAGWEAWLTMASNESVPQAWDAFMAEATSDGKRWGSGLHHRLHTKLVIACPIWLGTNIAMWTNHWSSLQHGKGSGPRGWPSGHSYPVSGYSKLPGMDQPPRH